MDQTITVGKRTYEVTEEGGGVYVRGQVTGASGRLLPNIGQALAKALVERDYPVQYMEVNEDGAFFPFCPSTASHLVGDEFVKAVQGSEEGRRLIESTSGIDRRYYLAERMGIKLGPQFRPVAATSALRSDWDALVTRIWAGVTHPFKYMVTHMPRLPLAYREHQYMKNIPVQDGDKEWLQARLAELTERINAL